MVKSLSEWLDYAKTKPFNEQPIWFDCIYLLMELDDGAGKKYALPTETSKLPNVGNF